MDDKRTVGGSFRDPSGFLFYRDDVLYRQINCEYQPHYEHLIKSGLYDKLVANKMLIPHMETAIDSETAPSPYKVIRPDVIPFISYPYEWCFGQLKDAALLTLAIQKISIQHGMSLKDASAYNIQFKNGVPIFIDTLSFEIYREGQPWPAYRQFCQHFLAPLALMALKDIRLNQWFKINIDGVPLDLASKLLPFSSWFSFSLLSHIHLHAKSQRHFTGHEINAGNHKVSRTAMLGVVDSLESAIRGLNWRHDGTQWSGYYNNAHYSREAADDKKNIVLRYLDKTHPKTVWDLGANDGLFSRMAGHYAELVVSFDSDPGVVENNYRQTIERRETNILPLCIDLVNPSPAIGWENMERCSLLERGPADLVVALALVHHLAIGNNVPLNRVAGFFATLGASLIIEFVPKSDVKVREMLRARDDIFQNYTSEGFEEAFKQYYRIVDTRQIEGSGRVIYLMERR
ncbi:MAG: SAM-dependent methyltransferase [Elusimicrobiota bacterium]